MRTARELRTDTWKKENERLGSSQQEVWSYWLDECVLEIWLVHVTEMTCSHNMLGPIIKRCIRVDVNLVLYKSHWETRASSFPQKTITSAKLKPLKLHLRKKNKAKSPKSRERKRKRARKFYCGSHGWLMESSRFSDRTRNRFLRWALLFFSHYL